jgi:hypothetical protein
MQEIVTQIEVECSDVKAWECLMDFKQYPRWNPFIKEISGEPKEGWHLQTTVQPPGGSAMKFKPLVLAASAPHEFRWKGILFMPGLFDGEHYFKIEALGPGHIRFTQGERFTGVLAFLGIALMGEKIRKGYESMNQAFKQRLETKG